MLKELLDEPHREFRLRHGAYLKLRWIGQLSESRATARVNRLRRAIRILKGRRIDLFVTGAMG